MGALVKLTQISDAVTVVTAGTAVQISSESILTQAIIIQADRDNTGAVFVGDSSVDGGAVSGTRNSIEILPGNSYEISGDSMGHGGDWEFDLSDIYIDALNNSDKVYIAHIERK